MLCIVYKDRMSFFLINVIIIILLQGTNKITVQKKSYIESDRKNITTIQKYMFPRTMVENIFFDSVSVTVQNFDSVMNLVFICHKLKLSCF